MLRFDIVSIFPEYFRAIFEFGIVRRARACRLVEINHHDLRDWTRNNHRTVDDRPFGGGDGMVLKPEPLFDAVESLTGARQRSELKARTRVVLLSPQGSVFDQKLAVEFSQAEQVVLLCGRYEGVDERVAEHLVSDEISIGDYVLSGGEAAAAVLVDAIVRLLPGALGSETSAVNESFSEGLLDCPHYTRPTDFRGNRVPEVLLGGNHAEIEVWRRRAALQKTKRNRPDLLVRMVLSEREKSWLDEDHD